MTTIEKLFAEYILSQDNNNSLYSRIEQAHQEEKQDGTTDMTFGEYVLHCIEAGGYENELNCFQAEKETEWRERFAKYRAESPEKIAEIAAEELPNCCDLAEELFGEELCQHSFDVVIEAFLK
jgi:hypothetical protein